MGRRRTLVCLLLVLALFGTACAKKDTTAGGGGDDAKPELTIAFMGDLTGANASLEIGPRNAAQLLVEQTNEKGDLPVKLVFAPEDTQGKEDQAVTVANKLIGNAKIVGVVGPGFSGESGTAGPVLEQAKFPRVTPSATNPTLAQRGWKYWFRAVANDDVQGGLTPDVLLKYVKGTKVFIAHDKTPYGQGLASIVEGKLPPTAKVAFEAADPGKEDYGALVSKAVTSGADVFYWGGYEREAGLIVKQLKDRGFRGAFVGADGSKGDNLLKGGGATANGAILTCPCLDPNASDQAAAKKFVDDYRARFGSAPSIYAAEGHDAALIIVEAIRKAGAPSGDISAYRQKVTDNVAATSGLAGLARTYKFEPNGELSGTPGLYLYKVQDGNYVLLGLVADLIK